MLKNINNSPLVSVCIITYNSSNFILDTLESVKVQTYKDIELIISDDGSKDNTVEVCRKWLMLNKKRFVNIVLLVSEQNLGISANYNRAINTAKGEWVKSLAGDDILLPDCIKENINFVTTHLDVDFVFSKMIHFKDNYSTENIIKSTNELDISFFQKNASGQLESMVRSCNVSAPTFFQKNGIVKSLGGCNLKYSFEDWPLWVKLLEHGYRFYYMDVFTVAYRHHSTGVSTHLTRLLNPAFEKSKFEFMHDVCFKYYTKNEIKLAQVEYRIKMLIIFLGLNHANVFCKAIYSICLRIINYLRRNP